MHNQLTNHFPPAHTTRICPSCIGQYDTYECTQECLMIGPHWRGPRYYYSGIASNLILHRKGIFKKGMALYMIALSFKLSFTEFSPYTNYQPIHGHIHRVSKICSHCFSPQKQTVKHCCCLCNEISAIYRQCFEIYR